MNKNKIIPVPEMQYYPNDEPKFRTSAYSNGSLEYLQHLNADGEYHGLATSWHYNGEKKSETNYVNGKRHGLWIYWLENGQKIYESNYVNDERDGLWTEWHPNGQKKSDGNYVNGKQHGEWKYFDEQGKLEKTSAWDNGRLVEKPAEETQPAI